MNELILVDKDGSMWKFTLPANVKRHIEFFMRAGLDPLNPVDTLELFDLTERDIDEHALAHGYWKN